jgi:hypothetical protein
MKTSGASRAPARNIREDPLRLALLGTSPGGPGEEIRKDEKIKRRALLDGGRLVGEGERGRRIR